MLQFSRELLKVSGAANNGHRGGGGGPVITEQNRQQMLFLTEVARVLAFRSTAGLSYIHSCSLVHRDMKPENVMIVSPDFGGVVRVRRMAKKLGNLPVGIFEKRRPAANEAEIVSVIGDSIVGKHVVIYDDIIDTGGTILGVAQAIKELGALSVVIIGTHGIFSAGAEKKFARGGFSVSDTNSIPRSEEYRTAQSSWLTIVSLDALLARAVHQASLVGGSVSQLST
jgi:ribose-phosphate pyrophosphokinase